MAHTPAPGRRSAPVQVRSMSSPREGWALDDAVRLVQQGYSAEQVERMTGFAAAHVLAQVRHRAKAQGRPRTTAG